MKLYFSVYNENQNSRLYPLFFYKYTNKNINMDTFTSYNDFYEHNFQEIDYSNMYKIHENFNQWLNSFQKLYINEKKFVEILSYDNITLWQFIKENLSWDFRHNIVIVTILSRLLKNNQASEIVYHTNQYKTSILWVKELSILHQKNFTLQEYISNTQSTSDKNNITYWEQQINQGKRTNIKYYINTKVTRDFQAKRILFCNVRGTESFENNTLKDNYIHSFVEYFKLQNISSYRIVLPLYPKNKKQFIDKHLAKSYYDNIFFDEFLIDENTKQTNQLLIQFKKIWILLCNNIAFQNIFQYKGLNLLHINYEYLEKQFTTYLVFRVIASLNAAKFMLKTLKPRKIFLTNEAFDISRAIIVEAQRLNIETIGLQHGIIAKQHWYYLDKNTTSNPNITQAPFYGFIVPNKTFVFGEYFKYILSTCGTYDKNDIYILPNWIMQNKIEQKKLTKEQLLTKYNILDNKKIILILSGVFLDSNLEQILLKHEQDNCIFIIKVHPLENDYTIYENILRKHTNQYIITKDNYTEFILYSDYIYTLILSTAVLDIALLGKKTNVYRKYDIIEEYPWEKITYNLNELNINNTLTKNDKVILSSIYCIGDKKDLFNKLDKIYFKEIKNA